MTQVPEAYKQAKKHILFHNYCIQQKSVMFNSRMNSSKQSNMLCGSDKYVFSSWVVQLNPSTQHTAMVHAMHTGTSTQNVLVEHSELVRKLAPTLLGL